MQIGGQKGNKTRRPIQIAQIISYFAENKQTNSPSRRGIRARRNSIVFDCHELARAHAHSTQLECAQHKVDLSPAAAAAAAANSCKQLASQDAPTTLGGANLGINLKI